MRFKVMRDTDLLKANRANLVKVSVQVNSKHGVYQSHRWKNPTAALNLLENEFKKQNIKSIDEVDFKSKNSNKTVEGKDIVKDYQSSGSNSTLQNYIKENYKVVLKNKPKGQNEVDKVVYTGEYNNNGVASEEYAQPKIREDYKGERVYISNDEYKVYVESLIKADKENKFLKKEEIKRAGIFLYNRYEYTESDEEIIEKEAKKNRLKFHEDFNNLREKIRNKNYKIDKGDIEEGRRLLKECRLVDTIEEKQVMEALNKKDDFNKDNFLSYDAIDPETGALVKFDNENKLLLDLMEIGKYKEKIEFEEKLNNPEEVKKLMYPTKIGKTKRGKPMNFVQADSGKANPKYEKEKGYDVNCQTCVVIDELRLRGYDVSAVPNLKDGGTPYQVSLDTALPWIDINTGEKVQRKTLTAANKKSMYKKLMAEIKEGERYTMSFGWRRARCGHIVKIYKDKNGELVIYDPQLSEVTTGKEDIVDYLGYVRLNIGFRITRVDNAIPNIPIIEKLIEEKAAEEKDYRGWNRKKKEPTEPSKAKDYKEETNNLLKTNKKIKKKVDVFDKRYKSKHGKEEINNSIDKISNSIDEKANEMKRELEVAREMKELKTLLKSGASISSLINNPAISRAVYLLLLSLDDEEDIENALNEMI